MFLIPNWKFETLHFKNLNFDGSDIFEIQINCPRQKIMICFLQKIADIDFSGWIDEHHEVWK